MIKKRSATQSFTLTLLQQQQEMPCLFQDWE